MIRSTAGTDAHPPLAEHSTSPVLRQRIRAAARYACARYGVRSVQTPIGIYTYAREHSSNNAGKQESRTTGRQTSPGERADAEP